MKYSTNPDYDHHDIEIDDVVEIDNDYRQFEVKKIFKNGRVQIKNTSGLDPAITTMGDKIYLVSKVD